MADIKWSKIKRHNSVLTRKVESTLEIQCELRSVAWDWDICTQKTGMHALGLNDVRECKDSTGENR